MEKEKDKIERIFIKNFNKYLDELTPEEWAEAANLNCGLDIDNRSNC